MLSKDESVVEPLAPLLMPSPAAADGAPPKKARGVSGAVS